MFTKFYVKAANLISEVKNDERGVTAIEYGLIAVAMAALLVVTFAGDGSLLTNLQGAFDTIGSNLGEAAK